MKDKKYLSGIGVDVGTMTLVAARRTVDGERVETKRIRDAFLDLDPESKRQLRLSHVDYVEQDGTLIVLGDSALTMANLFKREARRPLSKGVISAGELDAQQILGLLLAHITGKPVVELEHCYYSVPASPLDDESQDVIYHQEVFRKIFAELGYTPHPMNEALAIIYSQCAAENFSGIGISFGAGMANIALAYQTVKGMEFSVVRGGDWVDKHAAKAVGTTASRMCALKEKGIHLETPKSREEEAIVLYVRALIKYVLENIAIQFRKVQSNVELPEPIPLVISGGTSLAGGFVEIFSQEFAAIKKRGFPIEVSEIRHAKDPMTAVAEGLLVLASEEHSS